MLALNLITIGSTTAFYAILVCTASICVVRSLTVGAVAWHIGPVPLVRDANLVHCSKEDQWREDRIWPFQPWPLRAGGQLFRCGVRRLHHYLAAFPAVPACDVGHYELCWTYHRRGIDPRGYGLVHQWTQEIRAQDRC